MPREIRPRAKTSVITLLGQVALKIGLGCLTRYRLRASFCTILHQSSVPIKEIQKLMRHARVETTMSFLEVEGTGLREAVNAVFAS
jgi:site-specific recombinase XerD